MSYCCPLVSRSRDQHGELQLGLHSAQLGQLRSRWCAGRTARLRVKLPAWAAMATSAGRHNRRLNVGACSESAQLLARVTGSLPVARTLLSRCHGTFSSNCLAEAAMLRAAALHASLARSRATAKAPHQPFVAGCYAWTAMPARFSHRCVMERAPWHRPLTLLLSYTYM